MGKLAYPYERNRYYNGKLLQAEDFVREQTYFNGKLAFSNAWIFGHGILEGLRVQKIDGESILLEPGCCIDGTGRMVVVDRAAIRKLGTVEGFDGIDGGFFLLKLYYGQELGEAAYSALEGAGGTTEYATVRESYTLRLEPPEEHAVPAEQAFLSRTVLFGDEELRVTQLIPRTLWGGGVSQVILRLENFTSGEMEADLAYRLETPGFHCRDTGEVPQLRRSGLRLRPGTTDFTFPLVRSDGVFAQSAILVCGREDFTLGKRGRRCSAAEDFREEFSVAPLDPRQELLQKLRRLSPEELWDDRAEGVAVAALHFVQMERKLLLDDVILPGAEGYAASPALLHRAERYAAFYREMPEAAPVQTRPAESVREEKAAPAAGAREADKPAFRTGLVRLETGLNYKPGTVLYSEEVLHGLGPGMVYVEFGLEDQFVDQQRTRNKSEIILGENTLFEQINGEAAAPLEKAVKIFPDKGTFVLAVRSEKRIGQPVLNLRWYACRAESGASVGSAPRSGRLRGLEPDVAALEPKASVSFVPLFQDGEAEPCDFYLAPGEKGFVSKNGVYTAPEEEGLYMVTASVHGRPEERTSAFIIVRKPKGDPA